MKRISLASGREGIVALMVVCMEIKLKLEKQDWRVFNKYLCKKVAMKNKSLLDNVFVNIIIWMTIGLIIIFTFESFGGLHWPTAVVVTLVFVYLYLITFLKNKQLLSALEPMDNGSFCREHSYKFAEEGITTENGIIPWSMILEIERAQGMILLYLDTAIALVFPEQKLEQPDKFYDYVSKLHSSVSRNN